jgi:hypothetical protein
MSLDQPSEAMSKSDCESLLYQYNQSINPKDDSSVVSALESIHGMAADLLKNVKPGEAMSLTDAPRFKMLLGVHDQEQWLLKYSVYDTTQDDTDFDIVKQVIQPWKSPAHVRCDFGDRCRSYVRHAALKLAKADEDLGLIYVEHSLAGRRMNGDQEYENRDPKQIQPS